MTTPLLMIDTSGPRLQLALCKQAEVLTDIVEQERGHAEILFPLIARLLARAGLGYTDLRRIGVITGPGSFAGLRIGLAAARGLGLALSLPIIGLPRLIALSLSHDGDGAVAVLLDARRNQAWFEILPAPGRSKTGPSLVGIDEARALCPPDLPVIEGPHVDIARAARFAANADPEQFPPLPAYVREADAKPQTKGRVAHAAQGLQ